MSRKERAAEAKRLRSAGWKVREIAEHLKTSESSVYRDLSDAYCERNRVQCRERKRGNLKPFPEKICPVCTETFQPSRSDQFLCGKSCCKIHWQEYKAYYTWLN